MSDTGRASVWICEDVILDGTAVLRGCGFIGMYKPESVADLVPRRCPSCHGDATYKKTGDIALVAIETKNVSKPKITHEGVASNGGSTVHSAQPEEVG